MQTLLFLLSWLVVLPAPAQDPCLDVPPAEFYQSVALCAGDTLYVGSVKLTQAGNFQTFLPTVAGCDSIVYSTITLLPSYAFLASQLLCPGDSFRGQVYTRDTLLVERYATAAGCDSTWTYEVDVVEGPESGIRGDTLICAGTTTLLEAPSGYADYLWTSGAATPLIEAPPGDYRVTVSNSIGCAYELSYVVASSQPLSELDWRNPRCPGEADGTLDVLLTTGGLAPYTYELLGERPPGPDTFFSDLSPADYTLRVRDALGCTEDIAFSLAAADADSLVLTGLPGTPVERGDTLGLRLSIPADYQSLRWYGDGILSCYACANPTWAPAGAGTVGYRLVTENGCALGAEYRVVLTDPQRIYFPNAFSPNGDDQHDSYRIGAAENVLAVAEWRVYNRWGALVHRAENVAPEALSWDGKAGSQRLPAGVYVYTATVVFANGDVVPFTGEIHLLR